MCEVMSENFDHIVELRQGCHVILAVHYLYACLCKEDEGESRWNGCAAEGGVQMVFGSKSVCKYMELCCRQIVKGNCREL